MITRPPSGGESTLLTRSTNCRFTARNIRCVPASKCRLPYGPVRAATGSGPTAIGSACRSHCGRRHQATREIGEIFTCLSFGAHSKNPHSPHAPRSPPPQGHAKGPHPSLSSVPDFVIDSSRHLNIDHKKQGATLVN